MIIGIEKIKYDVIWEIDALLLRNILIFSKKSTIKKSAMKDKNVMIKNLKNSLRIYLSKSFNFQSSIFTEFPL